MTSNIAFIALFLLPACDVNKVGNKPPVEGVYVTKVETEYFTGTDTLEISSLNREAGTFNNERRTAYRRLSNGILGAAKYRIEHSTCVFNKTTAQLSEQRHGRIYSFSGDGTELVSGNSTYRRIR